MYQPAFHRTTPGDLSMRISSRSVLCTDNTGSRANPAGGRRKLPSAPGDPRNRNSPNDHSRRDYLSIPAPAGNAKTGLSRRRSRLRVPSVPLKHLQIGIFCCRPWRKRPPASFSSRADPACEPCSANRRSPPGPGLRRESPQRGCPAGPIGGLRACDRRWPPFAALLSVKKTTQVPSRAAPAASIATARFRASASASHKAVAVTSVPSSAAWDAIGGRSGWRCVASAATRRRRERFLAELAVTRDKVLEGAEFAGGETLLDVGCGEGLIGFDALERARRPSSSATSRAISSASAVRRPMTSASSIGAVSSRPPRTTSSRLKPSRLTSSRRVQC